MSPATPALLKNVVGPVLPGDVELEDSSRQEAPDGLLDVSRVCDDGCVDPSIEQDRTITVLDKKELKRKGNTAPTKENPKEPWHSNTAAVLFVLLRVA